MGWQPAPNGVFFVPCPSDRVPPHSMFARVSEPLGLITAVMVTTVPDVPTELTEPPTTAGRPVAQPAGAAAGAATAGCARQPRVAAASAATIPRMTFMGRSSPVAGGNGAAAAPHAVPGCDVGIRPRQLDQVNR